MVMVMAVAMAVEVMMAVLAMTVSMSVAVAVAVAASDSRAIDGQRGRAQRESSNRRHNEFLGPCHGSSPDLRSARIALL